MSTGYGYKGGYSEGGGSERYYAEENRYYAEENRYYAEGEQEEGPVDLGVVAAIADPQDSPAVHAARRAKQYFESLTALNQGRGRGLSPHRPDLKSEDEQNNVYKKSLAQLRKYMVGVDGLVTFRATGLPFDSAAYYLSKRQKVREKNEKNERERDPSAGPAPRIRLAHATFENRAGDTIKAPRDEWKTACIWAIDLDEQVYTNVAKRDRFHHSTFTHGTNVIGAGEWIVKKGVVEAISANSGHYTPTMNMFLESLDVFGRCLTDETLLLLYSKGRDVMVEVRYGDFKADRRDYKTHVLSPDM